MAFKSDSPIPIYRQIEQTADFNPPFIYNLLSFYQALETNSEELDGQFVPLTTVQRRIPREVKIFAVGLIPPSVAVLSDRLLDRSASIKTLDAPYDVLIAQNPDVGSSSTGDLPGQTSGIATSTAVPVGPTVTPKPTGPKVQGLNDDFFKAYVTMCNRLGCQPEELARVIQTESSWNPGAQAERPKGSGHIVAKGLIQIIHKTGTGMGMTDEEFANLQDVPAIDQLKWMEKFYSGRAKGKTAAQLKRITFGGFNNPAPPDPGGSLYSQYAESRGFKRADFQAKAYEQNKTSDHNHDGYITAEDLFGRLDTIKVNADVVAGIQKAKDSLGMGPNTIFLREQPQLPNQFSMTEDAPAPSRWVGPGTASANVVARTASQVSNKELNRTNLGKEFMSAQRATIRAMQAAIEEIANTPPLRLMVNPQSFRVSAEKVVSNSNWARNGTVIEHWGDNQDKIEGSGKVAAFYSLDVGGTDAPTGPGLTRTARQFSASYQNLLSLFLLYKNNGAAYFSDPTVSGNTKVKNFVLGSVYLYYDGILYIGSFDSLTLSESDGAPFTLEYSFSFTVRAWYLLDRPDRIEQDQPKAQPSLRTGNRGFPLAAGNNPQPSPEVAMPPEASQTFPLAEADPSQSFPLTDRNPSQTFPLTPPVSTQGGT